MATVAKPKQKGKRKQKEEPTSAPKKKSIKSLLDDDDDDQWCDNTKEKSEDIEDTPDQKKTDNFQPKKKFETGYVLFIGQLAYTTTKDEIWQHFESEGCKIKNVRLITDKATGKSRGFAYLDLEDNRSHRTALGLDKSTLGGRVINVEFTTIGSGKSVKRRENLKAKNQKLHKHKQLTHLQAKTGSVPQAVIDRDNSSMGSRAQQQDRAKFFKQRPNFHKRL